MAPCGHRLTDLRPVNDDVEHCDWLCAKCGQVCGSLLDAARLLEEVRDESVEDYRLPSYVVVQMTISTWEKLKAYRGGRHE